MNPRKKENSATIQVPSESSRIRRTSSTILDSLKDYGLSETEEFNIRLCIEEALRNAMEHGNRLNTELPVKVTYGVAANTLKVEIEDAGEGFDHKNLSDPTKEENLLRDRKRGVFLIYQLMDEVIFNDKGNRITMIKKLK